MAWAQDVAASGTKLSGRHFASLWVLVLLSPPENRTNPVPSRTGLLSFQRRGASAWWPRVGVRAPFCALGDWAPGSSLSGYAPVSWPEDVCASQSHVALET